MDGNKIEITTIVLDGQGHMGLWPLPMEDAMSGHFKSTMTILAYLLFNQHDQSTTQPLKLIEMTWTLTILILSFSSLYAYKKH